MPIRSTADAGVACVETTVAGACACALLAIINGAPATAIPVHSTTSHLNRKNRIWKITFTLKLAGDSIASREISLASRQKGRQPPQQACTNSA
jgi:hypothetical protein